MAYADLGAGSDPTAWSTSPSYSGGGGGSTTTKPKYETYGAESSAQLSAQAKAEAQESVQTQPVYRKEGAGTRELTSGAFYSAGVSAVYAGSRPTGAKAVYRRDGSTPFRPQTTTVYASEAFARKAQGLEPTSSRPGTVYSIEVDRSKLRQDTRAYFKERSRNPILESVQQPVNYISRDGMTIGEENPNKQQSILYPTPISNAVGNFQSVGSVPVLQKKTFWNTTPVGITVSAFGAGAKELGILTAKSLTIGTAKTAGTLGLWYYSQPKLYDYTPTAQVMSRFSPTLFPSPEQRGERAQILYDRISPAKDPSVGGFAVITGIAGAVASPAGRAIGAGTLLGKVYPAYEVASGIISFEKGQYVEAGRKMSQGVFFRYFPKVVEGTVRYQPFKFRTLKIRSVREITVGEYYRTSFRRGQRFTWEVQSEATRPAFRERFGIEVGKPQRVSGYTTTRTTTKTVRTFGIEAGTYQQPLVTYGLTRGKLEFGTPTQPGRTIPLERFAGYETSRGEFFGDVKGIPAPQSALEGGLLRKALTLSRAEQSRIDLGIQIGRVTGGDPGFPASPLTARYAFEKVGGFKDPKLSAKIIESFAKEEGYVVFGSATSEVLPVGTRNVKIGDIDFFAGRQSVAEISVGLKRLETRLQTAGEPVRISATGRGTVLEFTTGEKLVEVKSGVDQFRAGLDDAVPTGVYGFEFANIKGGVIGKTVEFGGIRSITAGEQQLRKFAGAMVFSKGILPGETPSFSLPGILGKQGNPRGLKDVAGFVQFSRGLADIRQASSNPFQRASGRRAGRLIDEYIETYTPEQRADILGKYRSITGERYPLSLESPTFSARTSSRVPSLSTTSFGVSDVGSDVGSPSPVFSPSPSPTLSGFRSPSAFPSPSRFSPSASPSSFRSPSPSPSPSPSGFRPSRFSPSPSGYSSPSPTLTGFKMSPSPSAFPKIDLSITQSPQKPKSKRREGQRRRETSKIDVPFTPKYIASIEATAFGIRGRAETGGTGLKVRPISF